MLDGFFVQDKGDAIRTNLTIDDWCAQETTNAATPRSMSAKRYAKAMAYTNQDKCYIDDVACRW